MNPATPSRQTLINSITGIAFAAGMMLTSDNLVRMVWAAGHTGLFSIGALVFFVVVYMAVTRVVFQISVIQEKGEIIFSSFFHYGVKCVAFVFLATSLLVSSGFIFNEVFLYWFPNFAFASVLLVLLVVIQFLPDRWMYSFQLCFVTVPLACLLILTISGLLADAPFSAFSAAASSDLFKPFSAWLMFPALCFVGFDLGSAFVKKGSDSFKSGVIQTSVVILGAGILFAGWSMVSTMFLSGERLTGSTIPHILAAKKILGDTGRILMGIIVISGSLAALNAILSSLALLPGMAHRAAAGKKRVISRSMAVLLGVITGVCMMTGLAGEASIDVYTKGALILWLVSYLVMVIEKGSHIKAVVRWGVMSVLAATVVILSGKDRNVFLMLEFLLISITVIGLVSFYAYKYIKFKK